MEQLVCTGTRSLMNDIIDSQFPIMNLPQSVLSEIDFNVLTYNSFFSKLVKSMILCECNPVVSKPLQITPKYVLQRTCFNSYMILSCS